MPDTSHVSDVPDFPEASDASGVTSTAGSRGRKRGRVGGPGMSRKAGLSLPVQHTAALLRDGRYAARVSAGAPVYLTAVLEYLTAEVLELADSAARFNKNRRINPRCLLLAMRNDVELDRLLSNVTIASGGVLPNIEQVLLEKEAEAMLS
eukprot:EG_transcript_26868